ncbi:MAG: choice-of-anchor E domain-containing protein [Burkholderiales bacterium]|nr:choice-of-anchor E domain-containing protein [Burkholderiales bacterium]
MKATSCIGLPLAAACLSTLLMYGAPAHAAVIVQGASFDIGGVISHLPIDHFGGPPVSGARSATGLLNYALFDASLGTLTAVRWQLRETQDSFDLFHQAQATPPLAGTITLFDMASHGSVDGHIGIGGLRGTGGLSFNLGAGQDSGCHIDAGGAPLVLPGCAVTTKGGASRDFDSLAASIASFIGVGSFDELLSVVLGFSDRVDVAGSSLGGLPPVLGPGPHEINGGFDLHGSLELVYEYTPFITTVPAPATLPLLGLALLALHQTSRRGGTRKSKSQPPSACSTLRWKSAA